MEFAKPHSAPCPEHPQLALEEAVVLGYNVERLRKAQQMSITTFSQMAGISRPTLYKIESGTSDLKLSMLARIAKALDTTVVALLTPPTTRGCAHQRTRMPRTRNTSTQTAAPSSAPAVSTTQSAMSHTRPGTKI